MTWLARELRAAGLHVIEEPGWLTRGRPWYSQRPYGGMQHHTAPPVPFPVTALYRGGKIKANWAAKLNGTVHLIASGACNYSSGMGSGTVIAETKRSIAPSGSAKERGLRDTNGGNSYYINHELEHRGDGSMVPEPQYRATILTWAVIFRHFGWDPARLIGHGEFSARKIDPYINGLRLHDAMNAMRHDLAVALELPPPPPPPPIEEEEDTLLPFYLTDGYNEPSGQGRTRKREDVKVLQTYLGQSDPDGKLGPGTMAQAEEFGADGQSIGGETWAKIVDAYFDAGTNGDDNGVPDHGHEIGAAKTGGPIDLE